jgi:hypothetical protein
MDPIGQQIINGTEKVKQMQQNYRSSISENHAILIIAAAICVGIATRDVIADVMKDAILPLVLYLVKMGIPYMIYDRIKSSFARHTVLHVIISKLGNVIWLLLIWVMTLYLVYLVFAKLVGIDLIGNQVKLIQLATSYVFQEDKQQQQQQPIQQSGTNAFAAQQLPKQVQQSLPTQPWA